MKHDTGKRRPAFGVKDQSIAKLRLKNCNFCRVCRKDGLAGQGSPNLHTKPYIETAIFKKTMLCDRSVYKLIHDNACTLKRKHCFNEYSQIIWKKWNSLRVVRNKNRVTWPSDKGNVLKSDRNSHVLRVLLVIPDQQLFTHRNSSEGTVINITTVLKGK